jgi:hypothetical protein
MEAKMQTVVETRGARMLDGALVPAPKTTRTIRRTLTHTPLARQHEKVLAVRASGRKISIPWARFDRSAHPEPALRLAFEAQRALAFGEYGAVDLFARMVSGLSIVGAPFDLVAAAAQVPSDEIRHADYAIRMASLCAGRDASFELPIPQRGWDKPPSLEELDRMMIDVCAIGETLAYALLLACRTRAKDPVARAVYSAIVSDELGHARIGWYYLAWRAPSWTQAERQRAADAAGLVVMDTERRFWHGRDAEPKYAKAANALGVLESEGQRDVIRRVMEDEIVPGLDALGLGASHAWRVRRRGGS